MLPVDTQHTEGHFTATETVRDIIIGMSDGLTVPFALAAGLTGAIAASHLILTAGLAEIAAGSISMGLGGYLAARSDADHYLAEKRREEYEIREFPEKEKQEVADVLMAYGLTKDEVQPVINGLVKNPKSWVDFMMRYELGLEEPHPRRALSSALTIAASYLIGGGIPLLPYAFIENAKQALMPSALVTLAALFIFGYFKGKMTGIHPLHGAFQTVIIGGIAALAAFFLASRFA